ncbi:hypothetical protein HHK36_007366 [Tetracentron sinense]|uniref:TCP domain-containing protein n=1 Tax=Tetracentron sinense TaxID=13715 RepID=A0A834ZJN4_TETSI|nr:hypothetical protein HHK36_007366 [Tetracentron sinense]
MEGLGFLHASNEKKKGVDCLCIKDERCKMITSSRKKDFPRKQEDDTNDDQNPKASSSSRPWSGLKDPRIVRVSRSFGGKDRHSKVCTIRGLRDRRVRLSVPTAIQLYDLQDRLGLNQPSKVVDWLLNAAKHDIDELPPLQLPPGNIGHFHQPMLVSNEVVVPQEPISNNVYEEEQTALPKSNYWCSDVLLRDKFKEVARETAIDKSSWIKRNEEEKQEGMEGHQVSPQNPRANHSSLPSFLNNGMPYNSYYHWDPSNLSLSHLGSHGCSSQTDQDPHNYNVVSLPSSLSLAAGSQLLVCPSGATPSFFPQYITSPVECDPRQINHFQMLSSSSQNLLPNSLTPPLYSISQPMRSFQLGMTQLLHPQNNSGSEPNKDNSGLSSNPTASFFQNQSKEAP